MVNRTSSRGGLGVRTLDLDRAATALVLGDIWGLIAAGAALDASGGGALAPLLSF